MPINGGVRKMAFGVFLVFIAVFHTVAGCPAGWYGFGTSCYLFRVRSLSLRGLNWDNARGYCLSYGGDLVSVSNKSEMDFIYSKSSKAKNEHYWIGLNDRRNESLFVWSDGMPYNGSVYSNWYPGEPNDRAGEDCVELYGTRWNDDSCKKEYSYICERPKGAPMPTFKTVSPPPTSAPIACPVGWIFYGSSCYKFSDVRKKWIDAKTDCRASGGYLLKIDDANEQHFISVQQSSGYRTRWIGLTDSAAEGMYRWESDGSLVNYTHWGTEEPNDFAGVEDCVAVWGGSSAGFWNDDYCDSEKYYICEKPGGRNLCPVNWRNFGDFCYLFNVHGALYKNWLNAEKACMSFNRSTELISINSEAEQEFVLRELKDMRISQVWLGLNDRKVEGRYEWSDKSPVTYKNWEAKEPATGVVARLSDCTIIDGNTQNGTWSTSPCFFRRGYICKRKIGMGQCDSPFGMEDGNIGDKQITASSSFNMSSRASQARLRLASGNTTVGAWCAARNSVGEYLQIDLGVVRQVKHIALQGRTGSSEFVRTFYLKYGNNGLDFNTYGENATVKYKVLRGSLNAISVHNIVLPEPINARFIRIYPLTWNSRICLRTEIYGCAAQASSKKCGVGWEVGLDDTCYQINSNQRKIWADARATCLSRGGELVSVLSVKEKTWLNNRLKALSGWAYSFWIGLNDRDMHKHFYWSDGSPVKLTAWDSGYPKDYTSQNLKACVEINVAKGAWRDVSCGEYRPFICKRKMASTDDVKYPVTGNWISGTDYYWPLDGIVNGKAIGTVPATVNGNVTTPDRVQNGRDVLQFASYYAYLDAGQFPVQCITDPGQCSNGITVSFVVQFDDGAKTWTRNTFIVDTIGDETLLQGNRGFAVYAVSNRLYVTVVTRGKTWTLSQPLITGILAWQHVMFTWQLEKGLALYTNGTQSASLRFGVSTLQSDNKSPSFIVGSKSTQPSAGAFRMRSLAVWKRSFSAQEVKNIYLAEFGSCRTGWKDFGQFCYQFNLNKKSWSAARVACVSQQAELVSIHSPVEQAQITLEAGPYRLQAEAWIGLHDQGVESDFVWSDGSVVDYTNWDNWNPDNWANSEDCANVRSYNDGRWNDQNCRNSLPYICKKRKEYIPASGVSPTRAPQTLYVCQSTSAVLSCPSSTILSITSAYWGRTDVSRCGHVSVTNCRLDVTSNMKKRCEGLNHCSLKASNSFGSDPCGGVSKYLEIDYLCKEGKEVTAGCPIGWQRTPDGSRCFGLLFDRRNWQDARRACQMYKADLASFHRSTENIVLTSLLVNSWDIADVGGVWIGLTDSGQKGLYKWTDGTAVDYSSWLNGQPDERVLSGSCVRATLQPGKMNWMFWQDGNCSEELPYACAIYPKLHQPPTPHPTTVSKAPCPSGWIVNGSSCYKMMPQSKAWTAARDACRAFSQNSDLVSIHSLAENTFVSSLFNGSAFAAWIGLSDRGVLFGYVWSDKSPLEFTRWNPQQPDSHQGQQPCVEMYSTGEWGDTGCYSVKKFICKMPRSDNALTTAPLTNNPAATTTQAPGICPPGWILWNTMCYYFANDSRSSKVSWYQARRACQSIRGGDLVSILSVAENNFIKSKIARHSSNALWIGLNDLGTESSYKWSDGSPVVYTNYGWKEPNDWSGQEDCLEFVKPGYWNDHHCSMLRPYICKKTNNTIIPAFTMIPPTPGPALGRCKEGWVNYDKSCYLFVSDNPQTWTNARDLCRQGLNTSMKGDLVTVDDQYEQAFLTTMLFEKQINFWIGFNDIHLEGTFFWTDNSPTKYTNWNAGEPQNWGYSTDCVHMTPFGNAGRWSNVQCDQKKGFICEVGALPLGPTSAPPSNRTCPSHYELFGDDCYFVSYVKLSWQEAREACQRESGGDLISVHGPFEQAYIVRSLKNFKGGLWLGFVREANSSEFRWSDNSLTLYTSWATKEPNSLRTQTSCVFANNSYSNAGRWNDGDCSDRNGFICRIRQGEPHVSPSVLGNCPSGWGKFDKSCYLFREGDQMSWTAARAACQGQGGNLVSITSRQEQDFIAYHYRHKSSGNLWIGLNDRAVEAGYTWSDGSPVSFLNWYSGEPNDVSFIENCVEMYPGSFQWNDIKCSERRGYMCKQPLECSGALGMVSRGIKTNQLSASSSVSLLYSPGMARLNSSSAWCANNAQQDQFIQVDLLTETRLTKISTQGFNLKGVASYIKMFKLQTSEDGVNFRTYQRNGKDWVFVANRDVNSAVTSAVKPSVDTRLIRLVPVSWTGSICLRMELYGCPFACETPLGMKSGAIKDSSLSASSSSDNSHRATNSRPSSSVGWCAKASDTQPWLQISFPLVDRKITKITTWGGGTGSGYVTVYRLAFTDVADVNAWSNYTEGGKIRNFRGNQDAVNPITHLLAEPIITRNLRVEPQSWSAGGACLRVELFGCEDGCDTALGLRQGLIEDSALSASSSLNQAHAASEGRLNGSTGWCASDGDNEPFFMVDLGTVMKIRKALLQGAKDGKGFIKSFTASTRDNVGLPWKPYKQADKTKVFLANIDNSTIVSTIFASTTLRGRYFKIIPKSWSIRPCLRLELFGCKTNVETTPTPSSIPPSGSPKPPKDVVYSGSVKLSKQEWTDEYKDPNSAAFMLLAEKVESSITKVYSGVDKASLAFKKVTVTGFRRGSVVVLFNLTFTRDMANELGANVTNNLVNAVKTGSLGELAVDPNSLNITQTAWNGNTGDQGTAAARTGGKSGGLSRGAKAGIALAVLILLGLCGGAVAWFFYRQRKGKHLFDHQQFDNPVYFSTKKEEIQATNGAMGNKPTLKFEEEVNG